MKTINVNGYLDVPKNFTGIAEYPSGTKFWLLNGKYHREDGLPAKEYANGAKSWWQNDVLHRADGRPAIDIGNGRGSYWINGKEITKVAAELYAMLFPSLATSKEEEL